MLPKELEECFYDDLNMSKVFAYLNKVIKMKENFKTDENKKPKKNFNDSEYFRDIKKNPKIGLKKK